MSEVTQDIIKTLGGYAIFSAAFAWLLKRIISHFLNKNVDKYKSLLEKENYLVIEDLKAKLQIGNFYQQLQFSKIHEKQAEIIAKRKTGVTSRHLTQFY